MTTIPALKEWAVICHALLAGEQIVDLRKGGLREDHRHFGVDTTHAWLYPTVEHQRRELLKPAYQHWIDIAHQAPVEHDIVVHGFVEITDAITITEPEHLAAVASRVIWSDEYAASRMQWKQRDPLWVLVMRAYQLADPFTVTWNADYGGCTSWVDFADTAQTFDDLTALAAAPALSDEAFAARRNGLIEALTEAGAIEQ